MSPLARSLLALAVVALLQGACAYECAQASGGILIGDEIVLSPATIDPGVQAASVDVPNLCLTGKRPVGEIVVACDDVKPTIVLPDLPREYEPIVIYRNGDYVNNYASVSITYYCQ